jgi:RecA-family ATPase
VGKSFFALQTTLAVASGISVFGVEVEPRPTLYLALEDSPRLLQHRIVTTQSVQPNNWWCKTDAEDLVADVQEFATKHPYGFIVIDTMQVARMVIEPKGKTSDVYRADYSFARQLRELTPAHGCLLVTHHTRKTESDDFIDALSGSQGLAGGVDYVMTLVRPRTSQKGQLHVSGRDVTEATYAMNFANGQWFPAGGDLAQAAEKAKESERGELAHSIVQYVNTRPATMAQHIVDKFGITADAARKQLARAHDAELIGKSRQGVYIPLSNVPHDVFTQLEDGSYV